jgi:hypothetical protein
MVTSSTIERGRGRRDDAPPALAITSHGRGRGARRAASTSSRSGSFHRWLAGGGRAAPSQEPGSLITGQTKLLTTPMSVAAPASNAAATSSSLSKSPLLLVSKAATAAA